MTVADALAFFAVGARYYVRTDYGPTEGEVVAIDNHAITIQEDPRDDSDRRFGGGGPRGSIGFGGIIEAQRVPVPHVQLAGLMVADALDAALRRYNLDMRSATTDIDRSEAVFRFYHSVDMVARAARGM